jgi:hypothetical protein
MKKSLIAFVLGISAVFVSGMANATLGGLGTACASTNSADAPIGVNDAYTTGFNTPLGVGINAGMLSNDLVCSQASNTVVLASTVTGAPQSVHVENVSSPSNGSLLFGSDGSFNYTPNSGFHGTDSFTYSINDNNSQPPAAPVQLANKFTTGPVTVTITVLAPPVLPTLSNWSITALLFVIGGLAAFVLRRKYD